MINYFSNIIIPLIIFIIIGYGYKEGKNVFDLFIEGAEQGGVIVYKIFPTMLGIFTLIGLLRSSEILDFISNFFTPLAIMLKIPKEIVPLILMRPISGSGSLGIAVDILKKYHVDSLIGMIVSTIMGSTETTIYTITVYLSFVKIRKSRYVLAAAMVADAAAIVLSVTLCRLMSNDFC